MNEEMEILICEEQEETQINQICDQFDEFEQQTRTHHLYMNRGSRREMLDRFQILNNHYGIFDGHGSVDVADYLSKSLLSRISDGMSESEYKQVFNEVDSELHSYTQSGSTALILSIQNKTVTTSSLGDSKAIVIRGNTYESLNDVQIPSKIEEKQRIERNGGYITTKQNISRVFGQLSVSRSFGDFDLKKYVISDPVTTHYQIIDTDRYIIIASDGFWDEITPIKVVQELLKINPTQNIAKQLYKAINKDYIQDNITIIVIPL